MTTMASNKGNRKVRKRFRSGATLVDSNVDGPGTSTSVGVVGWLEETSDSLVDEASEELSLTSLAGELVSMEAGIVGVKRAGAAVGPTAALLAAGAGVIGAEPTSDCCIGDDAADETFEKGNGAIEMYEIPAVGEAVPAEIWTIIEEFIAWMTDAGTFVATAAADFIKGTKQDSGNKVVVVVTVATL